MSPIKYILVLLLFVTACKDKLNKYGISGEINIPKVEKVELSESKLLLNDGLDDIWNQIFKENYVRSPYLPAEYVRDFKKDTYQYNNKKLQEIALYQGRHLERMWASIKQKNNPRGEILKYVFQESSLEVITSKVKTFSDSLKYEFGRLLVSECSYEDGFNLLKQLYSDSRNPTLKQKVRLFLRQHAIMESTLEESQPMAKSYNLHEFMPEGMIEIEFTPMNHIVYKDKSEFLEVDQNIHRYHYEKGPESFIWPPSDLLLKKYFINHYINDPAKGKYWIPGADNKLTLESEYRGEINFKLYKIADENKFSNLKPADMNNAELVSSWNQQAGNISNNNLGIKQKTEIKLPAKPDTGFYALIARAKFCPALIIKRFIVTKNLFYVRQLSNSISVIALDASTLKPAPFLDITIRIENQGKHILKTDVNGMALLKVKETLKDFIEATSSQSPLLSRTFVYPVQAIEKPLCSVWSSRPLYRTGEKISFRGIYRVINMGKSTLPKNREITIQLLKPDGKELTSWTSKLTATGSFHGEYKLRKDASRGEYNYIVNGVQYPAFKVGEFKLPRIQLSFAKKQVFTMSKSVFGTAFLNHLNGSPLAFGEISFELKQGSRTIRKWKEKTNRSGIIYYTINSNLLKPKLIYHLTASHRSSTAEIATAYQQIARVQNPLFISLTSHRLTGKLLVTGSFFNTFGKAFHPDKIDWAVVCKNGRTYTVKNNSPQLEIDTTLKPIKVFCRIKKGKYTTKTEFLIKDKDSQIDHVQDMDISMGMSIQAKSIAIPGEIINLDINMNLQESKEAYTVYLFGQNESLWHTQVLTLKPGHNKVPVKIKYDWGPNIFFHVMYIKNHRETVSKSCQVKILRKANELDLRSMTSKKIYKPGERCQIRFSCRNSSGIPVPAAEVSISVIDESLYHIKADQTPSLSHTFNNYLLNDLYAEAFRTGHDDYPQLAWFLGPALITYPSQVIESMGHSIVSHYGGGRSSGRAAFSPSPLPKIRKGFALEAFWKPIVQTDSKGFAEVSFTLPDTITSWRITARAISPKGKTGEMKASFSTSVPLETDVILPRVVRSGDKIAIPVTILNRQSTLHAKLLASATVNDTTFGNLRIKGVLASKNSLESKFMKMKVPQSGEIKFRSTVIAHNHSDSVERKLSITPKGYKNYDIFNKIIDKSASMNFDERSQVSGSTNLTLRLENSLNEKIQSALDRLIKYRYGCAEQTISRFTPLIVIADAFKKVGLDNPHAKKMPALIEEGLARLYRFQHRDGGWKWYETGASDYRVSVLVLEGLLEAKAQGVPVDLNVIQGGVKYINKTFGRGKDSSAADQMGVGDKTDFLAAVVLSRYSSLFKKSELAKSVKKQLPALQKRIKFELETLHLCEAMANLKMNSEATQILSKFIKRKYNPSKRAAVMTLSKKLQLTARLFKKHDLSAEAVSLMNAKKGGWWFDTRATHCAVRGIAGYIDTNDHDSLLEVYLNNKKVGTLQTNSKPIELKSVKGKLRFLNKGVKPLAISIAKEWHASEKHQPRSPQVKLETKIINKTQKLEQAKSITLKKSEIYTYKLTLRSKVDLNYCHITIPRPAGVELNTKPHLPSGVVSFEEYKDSFNFFIERLPAGSHTFEISFRADLKGEVFAPLPEFGKMYGDKLTVSSKAPENWVIK
jgi:hypothetical protein